MCGCQKTSFPDSSAAQKGAEAVARLNGHPMRAYSCSRCGAWHLTSDHNQILPWRRVHPWLFTASAKSEGFKDGKFSVLRDRKSKVWYALLPTGHRAGPFDSLGPARQWVDALTFLPRDRWAAEIERVSS